MFRRGADRERGVVDCLRRFLDRRGTDWDFGVVECEQAQAHFQVSASERARGAGSLPRHVSQYIAYRRELW